MKKIISLVALMLVITSCGESRELTQAKDELLDRTPTIQESTPVQTTERSESTLMDTENIQVSHLGGEQYLEFNGIDASTLQDWEITIAGSADSRVESIDVLFSNVNSEYADDDYTLQTFSAWDSSFKYIASTRNQVLDFGKNIYIFRAYVGKEYTDTEVSVYFADNTQTAISGSETQLIGTENDTLLIDLPVAASYGEPMMLWEASFTYTDIKGLEIQKEILPLVSCENLTEFLGERINTWYYWNTCREVVKDTWIRFNVIRLDGDQYVYERHYMDFENGLYSTYELETGGWVTSENIADKNTELKETEFETTVIVDGLIRDIIQN